jgi:hypothetical protein
MTRAIVELHAGFALCGSFARFDLFRDNRSHRR